MAALLVNQALARLLAVTGWAALAVQLVLSVQHQMQLGHSVLFNFLNIPSL